MSRLSINLLAFFGALFFVFGVGSAWGMVCQTDYGSASTPADSCAIFVAAQNDSMPEYGPWVQVSQEQVSGNLWHCDYSNQFGTSFAAMECTAAAVTSGPWANTTHDGCVAGISASYSVTGYTSMPYLVSIGGGGGSTGT